jgi:hypothetical protein
VYLDGSFQL